MDDAIYILNWFKLGGFKAQEYFFPAIFRFLTNLHGVLASSSFEPEQIPNAECVKKVKQRITKLCIRSKTIERPEHYT